MGLFKRKPKIIKVEGGYQLKGQAGIYAELWQAIAHGGRK